MLLPFHPRTQPIQLLRSMELQLCVQEPRCSATISERLHFEDEVASPFTGQSIKEITNDTMMDGRDQNSPLLPAEALANTALAVAQTSEGGPQWTSKAISARRPGLQPNRASSGNPSEQVITRRNLVSEHKSHRMLKKGKSQFLPKPFKMHPQSHRANRTRSRLLGGTQHLAQHIFQQILQHQRRSGTTLAERLRNSELSVVMQNHPKYRQLLRAVPVLVGLLLSNIRDGLTSNEGAALLEFGVRVAEKLVSKTLNT